MQGRVIKFNLMGTIGVILIIIFIIVGIIYGVTKDKKENRKEMQGEQHIVYINAEKTNITMKETTGSWGYKMKYDVDSFEIQKNIDGVDKFVCLKSDTVYINISRIDEQFNKSKIMQTAREEQKRVTETMINNMEIVKVTERDQEDFDCLYSIGNKEENCYYNIEIHCGDEFTETMMPIIEEMISTFVII